LRFNLDHNLEVPHEIVNAALCGRSTSFTVEIGSDTGASIFRGSSGLAPSVRQVRGITFDELFCEHFGKEGVVDLCKMDVECAEYEVFACPGHSSVAQCRWLIIEIHALRGRSPSEVVSAISSLGFEMLPQGSDSGVYAFRNTRFTDLGT
jgi:FkbM family methyltransferase